MAAPACERTSTHISTDGVSHTVAQAASQAAALQRRLQARQKFLHALQHRLEQATQAAGAGPAGQFRRFLAQRSAALLREHAGMAFQPPDARALPLRVQHLVQLHDLIDRLERERIREFASLLDPAMHPAASDGCPHADQQLHDSLQLAHACNQEVLASAQRKLEAAKRACPQAVIALNEFLGARTADRKSLLHAGLIDAVHGIDHPGVATASEIQAKIDALEPATKSLLDAFVAETTALGDCAFTEELLRDWERLAQLESQLAVNRQQMAEVANASTPRSRLNAEVAHIKPVVLVSMARNAENLLQKIVPLRQKLSVATAGTRKTAQIPDG